MNILLVYSQYQTSLKLTQGISGKWFCYNHFLIGIKSLLSSFSLYIN